MRERVSQMVKSAKMWVSAPIIAFALMVTVGPITAAAQTMQGPGTGATSNSATVSPDATTAGRPVVLFSAKGVFTITGDSAGACMPATCAVNACECQEFEATGIHQSFFGAGKLVIQFNETLNDIDTVSAGVTGSTCQPFYGVGTISGPAGKNSLKFLASGYSCGIAGTQFVDTSTFYLIPASGTGGLTNTRGTGSFNFTKDFNTNQAIFLFTGDLQKP
jgi:hypothetical protein